MPYQIEWKQTTERNPEGATNGIIVEKFFQAVVVAFYVFASEYMDEIGNHIAPKSYFTIKKI